MKILIVEDEFLVSNQIKKTLNKIGEYNVHIAGTFADALLHLKENNSFDLVFLDINLNEEKTGIDIAPILVEKQIPFVYLTANNDVVTVKKAIATQSISFVSKPFIEIDLLAQVELVKNKLKKEILELNHKGNKIEIVQENICYIKGEGSYSHIYLQNGTHFLQRVNLKNILSLLVENKFQRVHKSFIVNLEKIKEKNHKEVILFNDLKIPISEKFSRF